MAKLDELRTQLAELRARTLELADKEELTTEEDAELRAKTEEFDALKTKVDAEEVRAAKIEEIRSAAPTQRHNVNVITSTPERPSMRGFVPAGEMRDWAKRSLDARVKGGELNERSAAKVERILASDTPDSRIARHIAATGSDEYRSAFAKALSGKTWAMTPAEAEAADEARAASLTDAAGGFAVPFNLDPTLILTNDGTSNPVRQIARVVTVTGDNWNGVSTAGVTASWDAEGTAVSDDAPTLAQPAIAVHGAKAFIPFSIEIGMDWANFASDVVMLFTDAKDRLEGSAFVTGTGTAQPWGIVAACEANTATTGVDVTTALAFGVEDIYKIHNALPVRYRPRASWLADIAIINRVRQFGTSNNYHGYTVDLQAGGVPQLLGRPLYEASDMAATVTTTDTGIMVLGDFQNYVIADRIGMNIELVPHLFDVTNNRPTGQRGYFAMWRVGADSVNDSAFRLLRS